MCKINETNEINKTDGTDKKIGTKILRYGISIGSFLAIIMPICLANFVGSLICLEEIHSSIKIFTGFFAICLIEIVILIVIALIFLIVSLFIISIQTNFFQSIIKSYFKKWWNWVNDADNADNADNADKRIG